MYFYRALLIAALLAGCGHASKLSPSQQALQDVRTQRMAEALRRTPPVHQGWFETCLEAVDLLHEVNTFRESHDLPAFIPEPALTRAAMNHAGDMVSRDYFDTISPDGTRFDQRIYQSGYQRYAKGEVLSNATDAETAVMLWQQSRGHADVVLAKDATFAGVGCAKKENGSINWVLVTGQ